jgi:hypothetical protein
MGSMVTSLVSASLLGLLSGALSLEGLVLVPYWRSLAVGPFAELHASFAPRLFRFFAPLTTAAVMSAVVSVFAVAWHRDDGAALPWSIASGLLALSLLAFYRFYFHAANQRLPQLAVGQNGAGLSSELGKWSRHHLVRTAVCIAAFMTQVVVVASA